MRIDTLFLVAGAVALLSGCMAAREVGSVPCTYRFKMLTRAEDQARVETSIRKYAAGAVSKTGTETYPEYRFRVRKLADLDRLNRALMYTSPEALFPSSSVQALNLRSAGVAADFDSTDLTASASTTLSFQVKPGSRLYYKDGDGIERDITRNIDAKGNVRLELRVKEGQKFVKARAVKDRVTRHIRINIFTNEIKDIKPGEY